MFDFLKAELSGFKNVLFGYFAYINQYGRDDYDMRIPVFFKQFAEFYYSTRLGPPLVSSPLEASHMQQIAWKYIEMFTPSRGWNLLVVLEGMMTAEGIDFESADLDISALRKVLKKFPPIPEDILGF